MQRMNLDELPRHTIAELAKMYAQNWQTLDGLWFRHVEAEYGLEAATRIDLRNWEKQAVVEAQRIKKVVFYYSHCPVQEGRRRQGKQDFSCKDMKLTLLSNISRVVEPRASVRCLACPPDPHPDELWCKWELTMGQS